MYTEEFLSEDEWTMTIEIIKVVRIAGGKSSKSPNSSNLVSLYNSLEKLGAQSESTCLHLSA